MKTTQIIEKVRCPECGNTIYGTIEYPSWAPFPIYYGYCENCDYIVGESEWEKIER